MLVPKCQEGGRAFNTEFVPINCLDRTNTEARNPLCIHERGAVGPTTTLGIEVSETLMFLGGRMIWVHPSHRRIWLGVCWRNEP